MTKTRASGKQSVVLGPQLASRVDEWRRLEPDLPTRSEAIRLLLEMALDGWNKTQPAHASQF